MSSWHLFDHDDEFDQPAVERGIVRAATRDSTPPPNIYSRPPGHVCDPNTWPDRRRRRAHEIAMRRAALADEYRFANEQRREQLAQSMFDLQERERSVLREPPEIVDMDRLGYQPPPRILVLALEAFTRRAERDAPKRFPQGTPVDLAALVREELGEHRLRELRSIAVDSRSDAA